MSNSNIIYVLMEGNGYEADVLIGIFSSVEKAIEYGNNIHVSTYTPKKIWKTNTQIKDLSHLTWKQNGDDFYLTSSIKNDKSLPNFAILKHVVDENESYN